MLATTALPAYQSAALSEIFASAAFSSTTLPNMALMAKPADGFSPTRLASGTEVLWFSKPDQLPGSLASRISPIWNNGLGLALFRHHEKSCMGAIFLHGAMKTPWSAHGEGAWHSLGGIMAFSGVSFGDALEMVVSKGYAMTPKWRFIDMSLAAAGHPTLTHLGGGKAIFIHGPTDQDKDNGLAMSAEVTDALGIYISGPDQNMDDVWCGKFAALAPRNFVGSPMAEGQYKGMKPSEHTARAVFRGLEVVSEELIGGRPPIFFEGYGGVGKVMVANAIEKGFPISGLADIVVAPLAGVRRSFPSLPLFLNAAGTESNFGPERRAAEVALARENNITVVESLVEALKLAPSTVILSPNAGPHPITESVTDYLLSSDIRAVVGAANNMLLWSMDLRSLLPGVFWRGALLSQTIQEITELERWLA